MTARVLWLAKGLGLGGTEQLLVSSARHIDRSRFDVEVAYLLPWKDQLVPRLADAGIPTYCLGQRHQADLRWVLRLRRLLRSHRYAIVHTHMPVPAVAARYLAPRTGARLVHTEHNMWDRYRTLTRAAHAASYHRNDAVIAVSASVADTVRPRRAGAVAPTVLHHGIDAGLIARGPEARAHARRVLGLPQGAHVIGTVGNFTPKKDQATMLRAFAEVHAALADTHLVLIGSGPLLEELRELSRQLGVDDRVLFTGPRLDVAELLAALDVFTLSSRFEGLSIAMLEAMAAGVPPVVTAVGGVPEVVTDGIDGMLVAPGDPHALARVLQSLLGDDTRRAALACAARSRANAFGIARAVHEIESIYAEVLAR